MKLDSKQYSHNLFINCKTKTVSSRTQERARVAFSVIGCIPQTPFSGAADALSYPQPPGKHTLASYKERSAHKRVSPSDCTTPNGYRRESMERLQIAVIPLRINPRQTRKSATARRESRRESCFGNSFVRTHTTSSNRSPCTRLSTSPQYAASSHGWTSCPVQLDPKTSREEVV